MRSVREILGSWFAAEITPGVWRSRKRRTHYSRADCLCGSVEFIDVGVLDLAATFAASAINTGVAIGSTVGGIVLAGYGIEAIMALAVALCAIPLPATLGSQLRRGPSSDDADRIVPHLRAKSSRRIGGQDMSRTESINRAPGPTTAA